MKTESEANIMLMEMLKNILSMAGKPNDLSACITEKIRELVGCQLVFLIIHDENNMALHHQLIGFSPPEKKDSIESALIERIAEHSHDLHAPGIIHHNKNGTELEKSVYSLGGTCSFAVPLEYSKHRVGLLLLAGLDENNIPPSVIDSLETLSGVLALELRNSTVLKNLEKIVDERTRELSESEKKYRSIIEQATDSMFLCNPEGKIVDVNKQACSSVGYSRSELLQMNVTDLDAVYSEQEKAGEAFEQIRINSSLQLESFHRHKNGSTFPVDIKTNVIELNGQQLIIGFVRDITKRKNAEQEIQKLNTELEIKVVQRTKELEERTIQLQLNEKALLNIVEDLNEKTQELSKKTVQLEVSNKELEAFSYSVSHDLRAPLRAINGFATILLDEYEARLDDEGKRLIHVIHTNAVKMGKLIEDLLSFSRLIRTEIHKTPIDMEQLVNQIIRDFKQNHEKHTMNIAVDTIHPASCDTNMIKQVWINLISNAFKYSSMNHNALIRIGSEITENEIIYSVSDNGIGFDMNYAHKLFGVFQRLHNIKEIEGTGVGLAIIRRIVIRHGGRTWAEGEIDKGAKFYFTLPRANVFAELS